MTQDTLTYSVYHTKSKKITEVIESLQCVENVNQVVQVDSVHPEADRKTIVHIKTTSQEDNEKLDRFLDVEFSDFWFEN